MRVATRFFSVLLTPLIAVLPLAAQTPPAVAPVPAQTAPLRIKVVDRDAATVPPGSLARKGYLVEVTDASGKPVSGAAVVCRLPDADPTGTFAKAGHSSVLFTGANGLAHFSGIQWGSEAGTVVLRVTANKGSAHAGILIEQTVGSLAAVSITPNPNLSRKRQRPLLPPSEPLATVRPQPLPAIAQPEVTVTKPPAGVKIRHSNKKKWLILALVAGAAAGAVGFAARGKSSSNSSSAPAQMSIGSPTISVGQPQ